jgi:amidase
MGTETIGSIVTPASRAALYALKPTVGVQNTTGMFSLTDFYDSPGPMAKCAADVQVMTEILLGRCLGRPGQKTGSWEGLSVAFLDPSVWRMAEAMCRQHEGTAEQMVCIYRRFLVMRTLIPRRRERTTKRPFQG